MTTPSSNPGPLVEVADQSYAPVKIDQTITVGPDSNSGPLINVANQGYGKNTLQNVFV